MDAHNGKNYTTYKMITNMLKKTCLRSVWVAVTSCLLLEVTACSNVDKTAGARSDSYWNDENPPPYNALTGRPTRPWPLGSEQNQ